MSNRLIGAVLCCLHALNDCVSCYIAHQRFLYQVGQLERPFSIDPDVEFRGAAQISIATECSIRSRAILNGRSNVRPFGIMLGKNTYIKENCYFDAYGGFIRIDGFSAFGQNTWIHGGGGVSIGRYVITGPNCLLVSSNHGYRSRALPIMLQDETRKGIDIEDNVWLGSYVIVLDGVKIGRNTVVAAGTILAEDVPPNSIVYDERKRISRMLYI